MDPKFKTSFIPKQEIRTVGTRPTYGFRYSMLSIIGFVFLFVSMVLAVSVFFYQKTLVKDIENMNAELVATRNRFEPSLISEMLKLDKRLEMVKSLLNNHQATTLVFDLLEQKTLKSIRFTNLQYIANPLGSLSIDLKGEASNFSAVALQSDIFGSEPKLSSPVFSGLNLDEKGSIKFDFKANLNKLDFLYKEILEKIENVGGFNDLDI